MTEQAKCTIGVTILQNGLAIGELYEPTLPDTTGEESDTSSQNNDGGVKTKCIGWLTNGNLSFKKYYTGSAADETLRTSISDRTFYNWTVVMPHNFNSGANGYSWNGQIAKSTLVADGSAPAYLDMEVTVNGKMTPTSTAATGLTTTFFSIADDGANALTPSPAASATVFEYEVEAHSDSVSVTITPIATTGTIYVNGTVVPTTEASGAITLNSGTGSVTMIPITVSELNKTPTTTWLKVRIGNTAQP